jgi:uncharacterized protein
MDKMKNRDELLTRLKLNRRRLAEPIYRDPEVFFQGGEWYGDWQGRILLALCSLYEAVDDETEKHDLYMQITGIVSHLADHVNGGGYFGPLLDGQGVDEQQIAGHSWFLRGLCAYYQITQEQEIISYLVKMTDEFLLPLQHFFEQYPTVKRESGEVAGHAVNGIVNGWKLSSDVGCAFIMVDGMSAVYEMTHDVRLWSEINTVIDAFQKINLLDMHCQTHATLSFIRGVLRFYRLNNNPKHLRLAVELFDLYLREGMTIDYANLNWFGRPDSWTEPCAIVDSFIVAKQLYLLTAQEKYLQLASRIYHTSIRSAQRSNGGAGCNTCAYGDQGNVLKVVIYEAFFCCSMRLAEGLKEISDFQAVVSHDSLIFPLQGHFHRTFFEGSEVDCIFDPLKSGVARIHVQNVRATTFILYIPRGCHIHLDRPYTQNEHTISLPLKGVLDLTFTYEYDVFMDDRQHHPVQFMGDVLMTKKTDGTVSLITNGIELCDHEQEKLLEYVY